MEFYIFTKEQLEKRDEDNIENCAEWNVKLNKGIMCKCKRIPLPEPLKVPSEEDIKIHFAGQYGEGDIPLNEWKAIEAAKWMRNKLLGI